MCQLKQSELPEPGELNANTLWTILSTGNLDSLAPFLYEKPSKPAAEYYSKLNEKTRSIVESAQIKAKKDGTELPIHIQHAASGAYVYPNRWNFLVPAFLGFALYLISQAPTMTSVACVFAIMYIWYDLYSGIVHVNLDDTRNLAGWKAIILFQGCLEFQWHHSIPIDIVSKPLYASCADLNVIVTICLVASIAMGNTSGTGGALTGCKLLWAYFGQHSHRQSHTMKVKCSPLDRFLQDAGIMISQTKHNGHHRPPHDENFCLIGFCDRPINMMLSVTTNDTLWFVLWLVATVGDVWLLNLILTSVAPSIFT
mmetsp:Transcript_49062/g.66851  ORF Transcript_49062/g.66851 Transcript_49062/m.66851 type:complete len:312 (-) Transcript_49062:647-1582(-)